MIMPSRISDLAQSDGPYTQVLSVMYGPGQYLMPEKKLMLAVLKDAIDDILSANNHIPVKERRVTKRDRRTDAIRWMNSSNGDYVFSFVNICESVGFDPDYIRGKLFKTGGVCRG